MNIGLTSVTFRQKTPEQICTLAQTAHLSCIEWGGDIHCPPDNPQSQNEALSSTLSHRLFVSSYGSYYRLGSSQQPQKDFEVLCDAADRLQAGVIRIWAHRKPFSALEKAEYISCVKEAVLLSDIAQKHGITVCFEYHRGTLTQRAEDALCLMRDIGRENMRLYWQPNPDISHRENLRELEAVLPYVVNIHCFHWIKQQETDLRRPLREGLSEWRDYLLLAKKTVKNVLLEFVMNDSENAFLEDAEALLSIV